MFGEHQQSPMAGSIPDRRRVTCRREISLSPADCASTAYVNGNVVAATATGTVVVSDRPRSKARFRLARSINGKVVGPIHATSARVAGQGPRRGDVYYKSLEVQLGAIVSRQA